MNHPVYMSIKIIVYLREALIQLWKFWMVVLCANVAIEALVMSRPEQKEKAEFITAFHLLFTCAHFFVFSVCTLTLTHVPDSCYVPPMQMIDDKHFIVLFSS